jgi:hypothetical protein
MLKYKIIEETIPCGKSITTQWFDGTNKLVRQDVEIRVDKDFLSHLATGEQSGNHTGGL